MTDRQTILDRLRRFRAQSGIAPVSSPETIPAHAGVASSSHPPPDPEAELATFVQHLEAAHAEVCHVPKAEWADWVARRAESEGWQLLACGTRPELAAPLAGHLSAERLWVMDEAIDTRRHRLFHQVDAGISLAQGGISETGTLILATGPQEPRTLSLVPPVHVLLFDPATLYTDLATALNAQGWARQMPTNLLLISGPSKTADIQQTLAYGAHGPKRLLVLILEAHHG